MESVKAGDSSSCFDYIAKPLLSDWQRLDHSRLDTPSGQIRTRRFQSDP